MSIAYSCSKVEEGLNLPVALEVRNGTLCLLNPGFLLCRRLVRLGLLHLFNEQAFQFGAVVVN